MLVGKFNKFYLCLYWRKRLSVQTALYFDRNNVYINETCNYNRILTGKRTHRFYNQYDDIVRSAVGAGASRDQRSDIRQQAISVLKLARCPHSLAASLAALPSMSLIPIAPFAAIAADLKK